MPTFDRFDIVEAWYVWLIGHHVGIVPGTATDRRGRHHPDYWQSYNRLSWMEHDLGFKPRADLAPDTLTENGKAIYDNICRRAGWCQCLEAGSES